MIGGIWVAMPVFCRVSIGRWLQFTITFSHHSPPGRAVQEVHLWDRIVVQHPGAGAVLDEAHVVGQGREMVLVTSSQVQSTVT